MARPAITFLMFTTFRCQCNFILATIAWRSACRSALGRASSCPCPLLCCDCPRRRLTFLSLNGALANQNVPGHSGLFRRHGERIRAGLRGHPEGLGRSYVVVKDIEDVDSSQIVAVPPRIRWRASRPTSRLKGLLLEEVARCAAERARIGAAFLCKLKCELKEAGVFRGG